MGKATFTSVKNSLQFYECVQWYLRWDSNPQAKKAQHFECCVYASSTTQASRMERFIFIKDGAEGRTRTGTVVNQPQDFKSCVSANSTTPARVFGVEAAPGFEPGNKGFAVPGLTTWLCRHVHLLTTLHMQIVYSFSFWSGRRDSNPRPPPWQGGVLPLNYFRGYYWLG